ncbi:MAG: L-serine ammonia-lyase, iron-sulfur-dependent, subunit alpha [Muribaculaceae bacterium]|nr:L-serine ammonia-lyase, iron-sulfur-dependent, subunit alpha [Muribaculaceae bacterium]
MEKSLRHHIIDLIRREVVPAVGCTEPVAVALCVAKATEILGCVPEKIELSLSGNIIKNAMGVGIPGTGMIGLPIAVALGALVGKSEYNLEVLRDVTPEAVEMGKQYIAGERIVISLAPDAPSNLHIDVTALAGGHSVRAIISGSHTNFILMEKDGILLYEKNESLDNEAAEAGSSDPELNMKMVYDFATTAPVEEISFILEAKKLNLAAAEHALAGKYGHCLGSTVLHFGEKFFGDTPVAHAIMLTSAACDARMGGAMVPVMSNSGSGNQGITATMPVVSYAMDINASEDTTVRALALSHLTSIYIKQSLGRLSALCGCVVASTGAASGLVYLMGGGYDQVCDAVKNMVANLTGMICDGAKPSCSMKISSGVSTAMMSAMLAMQGFAVTSAEGIISDDVDETVHNLTSIGRDSMQATDKLVLKIMTCK